MLNELCRKLIEFQELAAVGLAAQAQITAAKRAVSARALEEFAESGEDGLAEVGPVLLSQLRLEHLPGWEGMPPPVIYFQGTEEQRRRNETELAVLAQVHLALLRDIVGNPFRKPNFEPEWRTGTVVALAQRMYVEKRFDWLPVLADALQEAGCDEQQLLGHCLSSGQHTRGCWAIDLVLGRE